MNWRILKTRDRRQRDGKKVLKHFLYMLPAIVSVLAFVYILLMLGVKHF